MKDRSTLLTVTFGGLAFASLYLVLSLPRDASERSGPTDADLARYQENAENVRRETALSLAGARDRLATLVQDAEMIAASVAAAEGADAETDGASANPGDREWPTLPRTKFRLSRALAHSAKALVARDLFRNEHLNPEDRYIPEPARQALGLAVASYADLVGQALEVETAAIHKEIAALVEMGKAQGVPYDRMRIPRIMEESADDSLRADLTAVMQKHALDPEKSHLIVPEMVFGTGERPYAMYCTDGTLFGARLCELPMAQEAVHIRHHITMELATAIVGFFRGWQLLSQEDGDRMLVECAEHLEASKTKTSPSRG